MVLGRFLSNKFNFWNVKLFSNSAEQKRYGHEVNYKKLNFIKHAPSNPVIIVIFLIEIINKNKFYLPWSLKHPSKNCHVSRKQFFYCLSLTANSLLNNTVREISSEKNNNDIFNQSKERKKGLKRDGVQWDFIWSKCRLFFD